MAPGVACQASLGQSGGGLGFGGTAAGEPCAPVLLRPDPQLPDQGTEFAPQLSHML